MLELTLPASGVEPVDWSTLEVQLYDKNNTILYNGGQTQTNGSPAWQFHPKKKIPASTPLKHYVLAKIFLHPAHICFRAAVKTTPGAVRLTAASITIQASISGTVRNGAQNSRKPVVKKERTSSSGEEATSTTVQLVESPQNSTSSPSSPPDGSSAGEYVVGSNLLVDGKVTAQGCILKSRICCRRIQIFAF